MSRETTRQISAAFARRLLVGRPLPAPRTCAVVAVMGKRADAPALAVNGKPLPLRRVVSICNEPDRGYLLDTDDHEWGP